MAVSIDLIFLTIWYSTAGLEFTNNTKTEKGNSFSSLNQAIYFIVDLREYIMHIR